MNPVITLREAEMAYWAAVRATPRAAAEREFADWCDTYVNWRLRGGFEPRFDGQPGDAFYNRLVTLFRADAERRGSAIVHRLATL